MAPSLIGQCWSAGETRRQCGSRSASVGRPLPRSSTSLGVYCHQDIGCRRCFQVAEGLALILLGVDESRVAWRLQRASQSVELKVSALPAQEVQPSLINTSCALLPFGSVHRVRTTLRRGRGCTRLHWAR